MPRKVKDLSGQRFGNLVVLQQSERRLRNLVSWLCKCDCGGHKIATGNDLRDGNTKSCGCLMRDQPPEKRGGRPKDHDMSGTRIHRIWLNMRQRCSNPNNANYDRYGGRGIRVCDEWKDFDAFYTWAKANNYHDTLTIERINNDGNYEPSNCKWATRAEQNRNKSNILFIEIDGEKKTFSEWAKFAGINRQTLSNRYYNLGWRGKELLKPVNKPSF